MEKDNLRDGRLLCHLVSLGCDKNLVDAEKMLGMLFSEGMEFTDAPEEADIILVNTCCFIGDAKEESVQAILEMAEYRKTGRCRALIVTGCMAERYREEILETLPEVDGILGTNSYQELLPLLKEIFAKQEQEERLMPLSERFFREQGRCGRIVTTGGHYAYLKIAEGCNKRCTYCIIPYLRGPYRSVPMEELLQEARELSEKGVKELILVAQETTLYGMDLYGEKRLPKLLEELSAIEGIRWIRILYCYPEEITEELIDAIRRLPKVCHYLDIPIQHASDHILKRMARKTTREEIGERIKQLRKEIPDICLRTTMLSGFPGETDADHKILLEFVREMEFDRLGDFAYSREEGTKAAAFSHQVSKKVKEARRDEVMALQQQIAFRKAEKQVGRTLRAIIEGRLADAGALSESLRGGREEALPAYEGNVYVARTYMDAPGVDGYLYIHTGKREFMTGDMPLVRITGAYEYDLTGELVNEDESAQ